MKEINKTMGEYLNFLIENSEHAKEFSDVPEIIESDLEFQLNVILEWIEEPGMDLQMLNDLVTGLKESL